MDKIDIGKLDLDSKDWLLQTCFDGFGTMQKTNYESVLFHVLMLNGYGKKTDFELSRLLKISETRVRNLRYKCSLEYPIDDDYKEQLTTILKEATYKWDGNRIQFCIPDKMLRLYTNNLLEEDGNFTDSSFNSSIVSLTPMDMVDLMKKLCDKESVLESYTNYEEIRKLVRNSTDRSLKGLPKSKSELIRDGAIAFVKDVASKVSPRFSDILADYISDQASRVLEKLTKK